MRPGPRGSARPSAVRVPRNGLVRGTGPASAPPARPPRPAPAVASGFRDGLYRPPPELAGVVSAVWVRRFGDPGGPAPPPIRLLPDGLADLVVARDGVGAGGPVTRALSFAPAAGAVAFGFQFRLGMAGAVLGTDPLDLTTAWRSFDDLWGREGREVLTRVVDTPDPFARFALVSGALARRAREVPAEDALLRSAAAGLSRPGARVAAVGREVGLSPRALQRRFRDRLGYGPKTLARIARLHGFVRHAEAAPEVVATEGLARIALDAGYADQAHLTREVRALTGVTPTTVLRERAGDPRVPVYRGPFA